MKYNFIKDHTKENVMKNNVCVLLSIIFAPAVLFAMEDLPNGLRQRKSSKVKRAIDQYYKKNAPKLNKRSSKDNYFDAMSNLAILYEFGGFSESAAQSYLKALSVSISVGNEEARQKLELLEKCRYDCW